MARIIRIDSPARARASLTVAIRTALADLDATGHPEEVRDRLAYVVLALRELERSTERTAQAWERRGYWLKVDQFRREWGWAGQGAAAVLAPLLRDDLEGARAVARDLLAHLPMRPSAGGRKASGHQWLGAFARLRSDSRPGRDD